MKKMVWIYNEEEYNKWTKVHANWMRENLPIQMVEAFEGELETLVTDKDKHGFMIFHLLHMSTLSTDDGYLYWEEAQNTWDLALPMMQAFNTMCMGLAQRANVERTLHAIGLANALMLQMFASPEQGFEEE